MTQAIAREIDELDVQSANKRKRGRPTKQDSQGLALEDLIIKAAKQVCCDYGVHALTVELILQKAGISRPTFYKFFKNKEVVLEVISQRAHQELVAAMQVTMLQSDLPCKGSTSIVDIVIDTYLEWGLAQGPIVSRFYQAITDETSIIAQHRQKTGEALVNIFQEANINAGLPKFDPLLLTSLINLIEFLGNPLFAKRHSRAEFKRVRNIMRMVLEKLLMGRDITQYNIE
ncbi:MAG: helix-turn-helix domain containing protein [Desulfobacteraceae bacterium]|nr:helix-turn-helix domain containing protein [Desulfobacteraceae bacterium]